MTPPPPTTDAVPPRPSDGGTAPCAACPLGVDRAVASHGPVPARLLFLSGAPRLHEEREGKAFASPAFAALETTLAEAGIDPTTVHYATLVGCRPPHQRPLRVEEIAACHERLEIVVRALEPDVVVVCGGDAVAAVLPDLAAPLMHGKIAERDGRRYYPIRHPYAALHSARYVAEVADDLRTLATLLLDGLPPLAPTPAPDFSPPAVPAPAPSLAAPAPTPSPSLSTPIPAPEAPLPPLLETPPAMSTPLMDMPLFLDAAGAETRPDDRSPATPPAAPAADDDVADGDAVQLSLF